MTACRGMVADGIPIPGLAETQIEEALRHLHARQYAAEIGDGATDSDDVRRCNRAIGGQIVERLPRPMQAIPSPGIQLVQQDGAVIVGTRSRHEACDQGIVLQHDLGREHDQTLRSLCPCRHQGSMRRESAAAEAVIAPHLIGHVLRPVAFSRHGRQAFSQDPAEAVCPRIVFRGALAQLSVLHEGSRYKKRGEQPKPLPFFPTSGIWSDALVDPGADQLRRLCRHGIRGCRHASQGLNQRNHRGHRAHVGGGGWRVDLHDRRRDRQQGLKVGAEALGPALACGDRNGAVRVGRHLRRHALDLGNQVVERGLVRGGQVAFQFRDALDRLHGIGDGRGVIVERGGIERGRGCGRGTGRRGTKKNGAEAECEEAVTHDVSRHKKTASKAAGKRSDRREPASFGSGGRFGRLTGLGMCRSRIETQSGGLGDAAGIGRDHQGLGIGLIGVGVPALGLRQGGDGLVEQRQPAAGSRRLPEPHGQSGGRDQEGEDRDEVSRILGWQIRQDRLEQGRPVHGFSPDCYWIAVRATLL
ncbi:Hypothetical protein GOX2364 [Gluconobacter oxydans 621H]|uniref:Uncharacterized protein n=1 Tax=Gluconobacter oxydans (strain 621H) TaxID=290633 RepID=Q5FNF1_GLUOX|nr:Hypothetical protein GOX2364 [Gluconobacter oxydans 621H]